MKTKLVLLFLLGGATIFLNGCASYWLRQNTYSQTKTVSDFLADQVLYNLVLSEKFWDENDRFNGIPSFIQLQTGQAQVQQSINGQLGFKFPFSGGDEIDPQITGNHQAQNNWTFQPVTDPNQLRRLFCVYKAEFKPVTESDLTTIFPSQPNFGLGSDGKPILKYEPVLTNGNQVVMVNNKPQFTATYERPERPKYTAKDIPGAALVNKPWFSFSPPSGKQCDGWLKTGPYMGKTIWITDKESFFKFAMLTLSTTNVVSGASPASMAPYSIQNGLLLPLR